MDLPIRRRRVVRASRSASKAFSIASAWLSKPWRLNLGTRWSSYRRLIAAAAVQLRSHDGCGLHSQKAPPARNITFLNNLHNWQKVVYLIDYLSLCINDTPAFREIQGMSSSPHITWALSCNTKSTWSVASMHIHTKMYIYSFSNHHYLVEKLSLNRRERELSTSFWITFRRLNIALELLHVPSIKIKFIFSFSHPCATQRDL